MKASGAMPAHEDTMLMFVGENIEVLSIASRREESAWQAPAIAQVITRKTFQSQGADTLSKALETVPGFYMAKREWGTRPYLRGIPDSLLLLYDTVPVTSDISKYNHPFDRELSLASVKRIEIIKGPGSVLWGPDAFAGIVNVVPMTGEDLDGAETGIMYAAPGKQSGVYANMGHHTWKWDTFLSVSGHIEQTDDRECNVTDFWGDGISPTDPEYRYGLTSPDESRYIEVSGRVDYDDWLTISGRIADTRHHYSISSEENIAWCENKDQPVGIFKIEARKNIDHLSLIRMTASFFQMETEQDIIGRILKQKEQNYYGDVIYDRSFFSGSGLLTGGISYREKHIKDAPIWDGYLPDYLKSENRFLLPLVSQLDYSTSLWSVFGQYSHRFGNTEAWFGLRNDSHDSYQDRTSFSTGVSWSPSSEWVAKLLYGTAYRTPFAKQLQEEEKPELENIKSLNLQIGWEPSKRWGFGICGFWNRIEDHVMIDPYSGLSRPNHQEFTGIEFQTHYSPVKTLDFSINMTLLDNTGPDEQYLLLVDTTIDSEGNEIRTFEENNYLYDSGADTLLTIMADWNPVQNFSTNIQMNYTGSRQLIYPRGDTIETTPGCWLLNITSIFQDVIWSDMDIEVSLRNVTDRKYEIPGTYSTIEGEPMSAQIILRKSW